MWRFAGGGEGVALAADLGETLDGGLYNGGLWVEGFRLDGGDTIGLGERP